jgi:tetratricopeptide (TPR) repeat protein
MIGPRFLHGVLICGLFAVGAATAQEERLDPRVLQQQMLPAPSSWRTRLLEADRYLQLEQPGRAEAFIDEAEQLGAPRRQTLSRRVELRRLTGEFARVADLCEEGLADGSYSARLLSALAEANMELGRLDAAAVALDRLVAGSPNKVSTTAEAVRLWRGHAFPDRGLALVDTLRARLGQPDALSRARAACLLELERYTEAAQEIIEELAQNPLNLPMVRDELLDVLEGEAARSRLLGEFDAVGDPEPALQMLRLDLNLRLARESDALALSGDILAIPERIPALLRYATGLARELDLIESPIVRRAVATWLLETLEVLAVSTDVARGNRLRVVDLLASVSLQSLGFGYLDADPELAVARMDRVLDLVRRLSPGSTRLYAARITLAEYMRDVQGRPQEAARTLEGLLTDLDLPLDGVALSRLALGECRLAAGDSSGARTVLTALGRDERFREAAGRAQYLLAALDLAQGAWESARDRFAAVALNDPSADHANDALDLGLTIAEELVDPAGGPARLERYAESVYWDLARNPGRRVAALRTFVDGVSGDGGHLLDRARLELAGLLAEEDPDGAAAQCDRIVLDHPDGHYAPAALFLLGETRSRAGDARAARAAWDRLLAQYPDAVEADDARRLLRSLP